MRERSKSSYSSKLERYKFERGSEYRDQNQSNCRICDQLEHRISDIDSEVVLLSCVCVSQCMYVHVHVCTCVNVRVYIIIQ